MAKFANHLLLFLLIASLVMLQLHYSNSIQVPDLARLLKNPDIDGISCGESCVWIPCMTSLLGCQCSNQVCVLPM